MNIENSIAYLCSAENANFYAYIFNALERVYAPGSNSFYVTPKGTRYVLSIDTEWAERMSFRELVATMEHEVLHIILNHVPRAIELYQLCDTDRSRMLFLSTKGIAQDLAVNEILRRNHRWIEDPRDDEEGFLLPEQYDLPRNCTFEDYLAALLNRINEEIKHPEQLIKSALEGLREQLKNAPPGSMGQMLAQALDDLADGDDYTPKTPFEKLLSDAITKTVQMHLEDLLQDISDPATPTRLKEHGQEVVKKTVHTFEKNRGTLPGDIKELIKNFLRPPTVSWTALLAALVEQAQQSKPIRGFTKISKLRAAIAEYYAKRGLRIARRSPLFPGTRRDQKFVVYFLLDVSGSMSRKDLSEGLTELKHIQKAAPDMEIYVVYIDAAVAKEYQIGPTDELDYEMVGRGGTDCEPGFQHVANSGKKVDILIYATDGYMPPPRTKVPCPVVWLLTPNGREIVQNMPGHTTLRMRDYVVGEMR